MRKTVFTDLHSLYPQRINSKTNGITFRRWLYQANPQLTQLLVEHVGEEVLDEPETRLRELEPFAEQAAFRQRFAEQRRSEDHTSELQSLMRISYAVFCLKKKKKNTK